MKKFRDYWKVNLHESDVMNFATEEMLNDLAEKIESLEEKHKCEHGKWKGECEGTHISYS